MSFDEKAKTWDTERRINRAGIIANEISNLINIDNSADISRNYSAMEYGCGTGLISFRLYDQFKEIALIDSSKGMIDSLNAKISDSKINNMEVYQADLLAEASLDRKFDIIYTSMVLHHIQDTPAIISKFYKLLNTDGYLLIVDLDEEDGSFHKNFPDFNGHNGFDQEKLKYILMNEGFNDVVSHTFYYDDRIIEGKKINYSLFIMKARKY